MPLIFHSFWVLFSILLSLGQKKYFYFLFDYGTITQSAAWGRKTEILPQCGQVSLCLASVGGLDGCSSASQPECLGFFCVTGTSMFPGHQSFGCCRVRTAELLLPRLCISGLFLMKTFFFECENRFKMLLCSSWSCARTGADSYCVWYFSVPFRQLCALSSLLC